MDKDFINERLKSITEEAMLLISDRLSEHGLGYRAISIEYEEAIKEGIATNDLKGAKKSLRKKCRVSRQGQVVCNAR